MTNKKQVTATSPKAEQMITYRFSGVDYQFTNEQVQTLANELFTSANGCDYSQLQALSPALAEKEQKHAFATACKRLAVRAANFGVDAMSIKDQSKTTKTNASGVELALTNVWAVVRANSIYGALPLQKEQADKMLAKALQDVVKRYEKVATFDGCRLYSIKSGAVVTPTVDKCFRAIRETFRLYSLRNLQETTPRAVLLARVLRLAINTPYLGADAPNGLRDAVVDFGKSLETWSKNKSDKLAKDNLEADLKRLQDFAR